MKSFYNRMAVLLPVFFFWVVALQAQSPQTFSYTGAEQTFTVPAGVTMVHVITFAATGGASSSGSSVVAGGKGGKVEADIAVSPGQVLYIYIGGKGISGGAGGFNGGGGTGLINPFNTTGGGGGASDIRIGGNALSNRVLVAGGGGGAGVGSSGGAGGGLTGGTGGGGGGTGGTPTAGGSAGGALGLGGSGNGISGGGGGYYGGGSTGPYNGGGGGGSSYTDPTLCSNVVHTQGASNPDSDGSLELSWTAQTYEPIVTNGGSNCSAEATYNYDSDQNGKPSFSADAGALVIYWGADNKWHIQTYGSDVYENAADTPLPPCDGWMGCGEDISLASGCFCTPPTVYALTGGGRVCDNGISITLSDSETGVNYQLIKNGDDIGDPVEGTGESLDFGNNITEAGIYTVEATRTVGLCSADMTGSATITPCFSGLGTIYCSDENTPFTLTGSEAPNGTFTGPGITDNGNGTATFNPSLAGSGGTITYTISSDPIRPAQLTATTGSKSADPGVTISTSQNVAVYLCGSVPTFTGIDVEYCDLDAPVTLTGSFAPLGFFTGTGITDNGDGTATFDPSAAIGNSEVRYLLNANLNNAWVSISAGYSHSMAIQTDGSLWAWGNNANGQFGNGTNTDSDIPVQIDAATDWASVSAGGYHNLAIKTDGTLWAWGQNTLTSSNGTNTDSNVPVQIGSDADWASISAGYDHSMAMKTDGTIWTWGDNLLGQLGNGTNGFNTGSNTPIQVGVDANWASIAAGDFHSIATKTDGSLWAWGQNTSGQLGDGTNTNSNVPTQIGIDTDWNKATGGAKHSLATKTNGTLWAWGNNEYGQIGNGNNTDSNTPVQIGTDADWAGISACSTSVAIKTNGTLWAWGNNEYGQIGNGSNTNSNTPVQVGNDTDWSSADAGAGHTMGLKTNGTLQTWGDNEYGQLGNGTITPSDIPTKVVTAVATTTVAVIVCLDFTGLDDAYCAGAAPVTLTGNHAPDGTFSGPGITDNGDGTASFDPAAAGTGGSIAYTYGTPVVTLSQDVTVFTSPTGLAISNISASDCKNTTCTTDDTYTADVTVTFNVQPLSGTVSLTGDDLAWPVPSVDASTLNGTSYTFTGVTLHADGNDIDLTATLGDCSKNALLGKAPRCFFEPHVPTNIELTSSTCSFINGTYVPNGTSNGAPAWIDPTNNNYIVWSGNAWVAGIFATNTSGSITEIPCTDWSGCGISLSGGCGSLEGTAITPPCSITDISIANTGSCNDNGTNDAGDDYFTADVTVTFAYAPENQNLVLSQGGNELASVSSDDLLCTTTWTFTGVQMPANGQDVVLTAEFVASNNKPAPGNATAARTDDVCTFTSDVLMTAPASCSCVPPTFTACPTNKTAFTSANACTAAVEYVATANGVPTSVMTYAFTGLTTGMGNGSGSGTTFNKGVTTVTLTATNDCGAPTCQFTVTVTDNVKPVITCPADRTVNADQGQCSSVQTYTVTTTDNCSATTQPTAGLSNGAAFPVGITINAFLATDAAGNTATCSFSIRVLDTQLPVVTCPANTTLGIGDNCSTPLASYGLATKSDNCSTAIFETQSPVAGTIVTGHNTAQTVTLTATDASGNTASCSFVVILKDVMVPSITCPANIIRPTDPNLCGAVVTYATPIYSDNCSGGGAVHINGGTSGSTFDKGISTVNWQATDGVGLTKTCSFTITVNDAQAPTITCPANIVRNNDAGQCSAVVTYSTPKAADNCSLPAGQPQWVSGGTTPTASGANSTATFQKGANIVTWRATDGAGLTKTCTFRVTVNDTEAPTLTCPAPMSLTTATNTCSSVATYTNPTFTDNCALTNSTATRISGLVSGSSFPLGNSNVVFQATDAAGNTRRCTMVVTVTDNQPPVITCPAAVVATGTGTPCRATVFYGSTTASDNCAGTLTPFLVTGLASGSQFPAGVTTNTFRAVAPNGQSSECSFMVTVDCGSGMGNNGVEVRNANLSIQHGDKLELKLAPNPALSTVTVSIEGVGAGGGTLLVYDAVGRLVLRQVIAENQQTAVFQVDGSEFAPGMYRVNLRTASGMATKTLVVVK